MKVLVCVKQVHDSAAATRIDDTGRWIATHEGTPSRLNRVDEVAVEAALRLKETRADVTTCAITVGPAWHDRAVRRALGMGIDDGLHVVTPRAEHESASRVAAWIAGAARGRGFDLLLAGVESEDLMQGATGPMVAERLGLPCAVAVVAIEVTADGRAARVERELEGGRRETVEIDLPAVLTVQSGLARPRYPVLRHVLRANRQPIGTVPAATLDAPDADTEIAGLAYPGKTRGGVVLGGTAPEKAAALVALLRAKALLPGR